MYKFLVVDDEEIVRRGFRKKIAWEEAGFEYLEPCKNGREAIERISEEKPDVVMTDICMPLVDGLEVAVFIAEKYPEIIVFILTGYDEFEFARSALRCNVVEYLLKPITSSELSTFVAKLKMRLDETADHSRQQRYNRSLFKFPAQYQKNNLFDTSASKNLPVTKVAEAKEYIERNFFQKELSVDKICRDLYISPSYLSHLFKRHLGRTFVDVLTEYRIEKAKQLLSFSDLKTCAVADAVGYSDPHYFSTIFKKVTGVTPSSYRETIPKPD